MIPAAAFVLAAACGLVLGSYAVTMGVRWAGAEAGGRRSQCDACGHPLGFGQTVPVVSYVWLRGACRHCGARIDPIHLAGELVGATVLMLVPWSTAPLQSILISLVALCLLTAAVVDLRTQTLPDSLTAVVAVAALVLSARGGWTTVLIGLAAAALTFALLGLLRWGFARRHDGEPGLGFGDVKLASALALWLGAGTPWMMVAACSLGLASAVIRRLPRDQRMPLGPMLAAGGLAIGLLQVRGGLPWRL